VSGPEVAGFEDLVEVGRGGFGVVYRADQPDFNRSVAIKVLSGTLDDQARQRFDRERRAMGSLSTNPNIVTVYASGFTAEASPYIVMEYVTGGSLADRLERGPVPWAEVIEIGIKLSGALEAAHRIGMLHRDIKPENVLVSDYGEPKLADFGIARLQGAFETQSAILASPVYAPPEVLSGERPSEASDVYSLASTLYTLIAGQSPFVRNSDESMLPVITRVLTERVPDLRPRGIPDAVCTVLEAAMEKDLTLRTPTATAFSQQLSVSAPREDSGETRSMGALPRIPEPQAPGPTPKPRRTRLLIGGLVLVGIVVGGVMAADALTGGSSKQRSSGTASATSPTSASTSAQPTPNTAPSFPTQIQGFSRQGPPVSLTTRVFAGQPNYISDFPATMNGCDQAVITTRWRSLGGNVTAGNADGHFNGLPPPAAPRDAQTGQAGLIQGNQCEEPVFFLAPGPLGTLVDVSVEYQVWQASP
jgi:serine/threonine protein kinase